MNNDIQEAINLFQSNKLNLAENKMIDLTKKYPNNHILFNLYGIILAGQNKLEDSINKYKKSIQINQNFFEAYNNLSGAFFKLKKYDESINTLKKAIQINPNFAEAYYNLGNVYHEIEKFNESIDNYKHAIKINPKYAKAYNNLGNSYREIEKTKESINNYKQAIKIDSNFVDPYYNLAVILMKIKKIEEAILFYEKAIKINNNFEQVYNNLSIIYNDIGKVKESHRCFQKLININPNNIKYKINMNLQVTPIVESSKEINLYRSKYKKGLESIKKLNYKTEEPGESIESNFFYLAFHNKKSIDLMRKTSKIFSKIMPNIKYVSRNLKKVTN